MVIVKVIIMAYVNIADNLSDNNDIKYTNDIRNIY